MKREGAAKKARSAWLGLWVVAVVMAGCAGFTADKHTYARGEAGARLNGAALCLRVRPEGDTGKGFVMSAMIVTAGAATLDGPFSWRIEATGVEGRHQRMVVYRLHTRTEGSGRSEWYPAKELGRAVEFRRVKGEAGEVVARYRIPGQLRVKPGEDGALVVTAEIGVEAGGRWERGVVRFRLDPDRKRQTEVMFLPAEIVRGIATDPADWDDPLWD